MTQKNEQYRFPEEIRGMSEEEAEDFLIEHGGGIHPSWGNLDL